MRHHVQQLANGSRRTQNQAWIQRAADESSQVRPLTQLQAIANSAGPARLPAQSSQSAPIQRVMIDKVDITSSTPLRQIEDALRWSGLYGVQAELTEKQKQDLIKELEGREDCKSIVTELREDLDAEESSSGSESAGNEELNEKSGEDDGFDDPALFDPFPGLSSINANSGAQAEEARRRAAAEKFGWKQFPEAVSGLKKLGVHETSPGNVAALVADGPSAERLGTGNGLGKGPGFYVTHVGQKTLYNAIKGVSWGEQFLAVYVPGNLQRIKSAGEETNHTEILDEKYGNPHAYYVMSGGSEIVIPVRHFGLIRLVTNPDQLLAGHDDEEDDEVVSEAEGDGGHRALIQAIYEEEVSFARRMNEISDRFNSATSEPLRRRIAKRWNFLERILFNRWMTNGQQYTLWWNAKRVGERVEEPSPPEFG